MPVELLWKSSETTSRQAPSIPPPSKTIIRLNVNGVSHRAEVEDRWPLAERLRDQLDLTGTKIGRDHSECGACTVLGRMAHVEDGKYLSRNRLMLTFVSLGSESWCSGAAMQLALRPQNLSSRQRYPYRRPLQLPLL